ncbi:MAG: cupin domain-containing protein [Gammaproteobacteria bacterium]|nr:cupin domain-containing protein [Gammaproteobacteria bacterium]
MKTILCGISLILSLSGNAWARDLNTVKVDVLAKTSSSWDGGTLPDYSPGRPEVTILKVVVPPHTQLPLHKHPVINAGVLLKGNLTVVTEDNKTLHMTAGDPIVEVVNKWHYGKNEGNEPAEIIVFYAGTQGNPITIKRSSTPPAPVKQQKD